MATKDFSSLQEHTVAYYLGWKVVSGSGARNFYKGDIESNTWLGECKTHMTKKSKIQFKKEHWDKICKEAIGSHKSPVLIVDDGTQSIKNTWCLIPRSYAFGIAGDYAQFPNTVRTNIQFDPDELRLDMRLNRYSGYVVEGFGDDIPDVEITTLEVFQQYFGRI